MSGGSGAEIRVPTLVELADRAAMLEKAYEFSGNDEGMQAGLDSKYQYLAGFDESNYSGDSGAHSAEAGMDAVAYLDTSTGDITIAIGGFEFEDFIVPLLEFLDPTTDTNNGENIPVQDFAAANIPCPTMARSSCRSWAARPGASPLPTPNSGGCPCDWSSPWHPASPPG